MRPRLAGTTRWRRSYSQYLPYRSLPIHRSESLERKHFETVWKRILYPGHQSMLTRDECLAKASEIERMAASCENALAREIYEAMAWEWRLGATQVDWQGTFSVATDCF
jgi:hypothetical protein